MLKWLLRIVYVFLLLLITSYVVFAAQMGRHSKYYDEHVLPLEVESEDSEQLYYKNFFNFYVNFYGFDSGTLDINPVIDITADEATYSYTYRMYTFTFENEDEEMFGYYGVFRNLSFKNAEGESLVNPEVTYLFEFNNEDFSDKVSISPSASSILQNSVQLILDGAIRVNDENSFFFYTKIDDADKFSNYLTHVSYAYKESGSESENQTFLVINHDNEAVNNGYVHNSTVAYTGTPILINGHIDAFNYHNATNITTFDADTSAIKAYNSSVVSTIVIYAVIVLLITFLLFFRKPLKAHLEKKRTEKFKNNDHFDNLEESKPIEPIFQDITETDQK